MYNGGTEPLQVEMLAASLLASYTDVKTFLETLAFKFEGSLPSHTRVIRHKSFFSRERPVKEIIVTLGDYQYRLSREQQGPLAAQRAHVVRGIIIGTEPLSVEQWINAIAEALAQLSASSTLDHAALLRFLQS